MRKGLFLLLWGWVSLCTHAQGYFEAGYTPSRSFMKEDEDDILGAGSMWQLKGRYTFRFSAKQNKIGQPVIWSGTLNGMYARMENEDGAAVVNPDEVLNAGFTVSHMRPLSERWYLMVSLGIGLYAVPDEISFRSVLVNGAVIFAYRLRNNLDVGIGVGLTNSYGVPLVMPMGFLKWNVTGKYEVSVEMAGSMKAAVARRFSERFGLTLVPIEMDGLSAVVRQDGEHKIYGVTRARAYISPELKVGKWASVYVSAGIDLLHSVKLSDRSFKGFVNAFNGGDSWEFERGNYLTAGFRYGF